MTNLLLHLYKLMLRLYPSRFHQTFGPEMAEVFAQKLYHAADNRTRLVAFVRELRCWPGSLLREHWAAQQEALNSPNYEKLSWRGTAVAALPYVLMAILFGAVYLVAELIFSSSPGSTLYNTATAVVIGIFIIILAVAWRRNWPGWSVSWLGFLVFLAFYVALPQLILQVQFAWNTPAHLLQTIVSAVIPPLLLFGAFYWLVGRWPYTGAVILLPPIGLSWRLHMGLVPQHIASLIFVLTWSWLAVVAVLMMRLGNGRWQGWLLGLAGSIIGMGSAFASQLGRKMPPLEISNIQISQSTASGTGNIIMSNAISISQLLQDFLAEFAPTLLPLVAILLLHALRRKLVAGNGRSTLRHYRFLFWGIIGIIVAGQTGEALTWPYDLPAFEGGIGILVTAVFLLGIVGVILGMKGLLHRQPGHLLLLLALFPFLYQAETITALLAELINWGSLNQFILQEMIQLVSQVLGLIWLGLAAWLLGRIYSPWPPKPADGASPLPAS